MARNKMMIAIPSRGRHKFVLGQRDTLNCLHESLREHTFLFNHVDDEDNYRTDAIKARVNDIVTLGYWSIGEKRRQMAVHAMKLGYEKIMMIDDDINLLVRRAPDNWQLRYTEEAESVDMYNDVIGLLDSGYGQVSLGAREGNNRLGLGGREAVQDHYRGMRANAFDIDEFLSLEHSRVPVMEDFDVSLQLLRRKRLTCVTVYWATGQKATNTEGGCAIWRTHALHESAVYRLMELHPGLVSARIKENKGGGDFGTRVEATIQWKRAYETGKEA